MRRIAMVSGILLLAATWLGPLPSLSYQAFYAHMTMHMLVVAVAAPLLAIGIAGSRLDPVDKVPWLFPPLPISLLELLVVWAWHSPLLHHAARTQSNVMMIEQSMFLLSGLLLWLSVFGGSIALREERRAAGVIGLLLTSMHMTLLGALLALSTRPLFHHLPTTGGMTALEDQHLGGAIMLIVGGIAYLTGGVVLILGLIRQRGSLARNRT